MTRSKNAIKTTGIVEMGHDPNDLITINQIYFSKDVSVTRKRSD